MPNEAIAFALLALAAGAGIPVMARLNASLGQSYGSGGWAAAVLAIVGFAAIAGWLALRREPLPAAPFAAAPALYFGGLLFGFYILSITFLIPRFGVGPSILCVVTGQIVAASVIDHFGLLGSPVRPLDAARGLGVLMMLAGVALVAAPRE